MKRIQFVTATLVALILAVATWTLPFSRLIDGFIYDKVIRFQPTGEFSERIVVVGIDDLTLSENRLPLVLWHEQIAAVIDGIALGGARRLGIDLIEAVSMEQIKPELDRLLMSSIKRATQNGTEVYLGFSFGQYGAMPERKFAFVATNLGFLNLFPDPDGVIRRQILSTKGSGGNSVYSMPFFLAKSSKNPPAPLSDSNYIDFRKPLPQTVSFHSILQLAQDNSKEELEAIFQDSIVLIGVTTRKMYDIHKIPMRESLGKDHFISGVQLLALMTDTIASDRNIQNLPKFVSIILLLILACISVQLFIHLPPHHAAVTITALLVISSGAVYALFSLGYVIPASVVVGGMLLPSITGLLSRLLHERQFRKTLNRFVRSYVNVNRLEHLMHDPRERLRQERDLKAGIERREQVLYYQPKVDIENGTIVGIEALVRWFKPNGEFVSPGVFIPLAEETGLVNKLTELIIDRAFSFAVRLHKAAAAGSRPAPKISINLSARDLERADLGDILKHCIEHYSIKAQYIDLEITESSVIQDMGEAIQRISSLRDLGFTISIDDFGAGYSSLGYITQIPLDYLKVDKSLIDFITNDKRSSAVVQAIVAMAKGLGVKVIAEGVEDNDQLRHLQSIGCDQVQGYIFSKPLPEDQLLELIESAKTFECNPE